MNIYIDQKENREAPYSKENYEAEQKATAAQKVGLCAQQRLSAALPPQPIAPTACAAATHSEELIHEKFTSLMLAAEKKEAIAAQIALYPFDKQQRWQLVKSCAKHNSTAIATFFPLFGADFSAPERWEIAKSTALNPNAITEIFLLLELYPFSDFQRLQLLKLCSASPQAALALENLDKFHLHLNSYEIFQLVLTPIYYRISAIIPLLSHFTFTPEQWLKIAKACCETSYSKNSNNADDIEIESKNRFSFALNMANHIDKLTEHLSEEQRCAIMRECATALLKCRRSWNEILMECKVHVRQWPLILRQEFVKIFFTTTLEGIECFLFDATADELFQIAKTTLRDSIYQLFWFNKKFPLSEELWFALAKECKSHQLEEALRIIQHFGKFTPEQITAILTSQSFYLEQGSLHPLLQFACLNKAQKLTIAKHWAASDPNNTFAILPVLDCMQVGFTADDHFEVVKICCQQKYFHALPANAVVCAFTKPQRLELGQMCASKSDTEIALKKLSVLGHDFTLEEKFALLERATHSGGNYFNPEELLSYGFTKEQNFVLMRYCMRCVDSEKVLKKFAFTKEQNFELMRIKMAKFQKKNAYILCEFGFTTDQLYELLTLSAQHIVMIPEEIVKQLSVERQLELFSRWLAIDNELTLDALTNTLRTYSYAQAFSLFKEAATNGNVILHGSFRTIFRWKWQPPQRLELLQLLSTKKSYYTASYIMQELIMHQDQYHLNEILPVIKLVAENLDGAEALSLLTQIKALTPEQLLELLTITLHRHGHLCPYALQLAQPHISQEQHFQWVKLRCEHENFKPSFLHNLNASQEQLLILGKTAAAHAPFDVLAAIMEFPITIRQEIVQSCLKFNISLFKIIETQPYLTQLWESSRLWAHKLFITTAFSTNANVEAVAEKAWLLSLREGLPRAKEEPAPFFSSFLPALKAELMHTYSQAPFFPQLEEFVTHCSCLTYLDSFYEEHLQTAFEQQAHISRSRLSDTFYNILRAVLVTAHAPIKKDALELLMLPFVHSTPSSLSRPFFDLLVQAPQDSLPLRLYLFGLFHERGKPAKLLAQNFDKLFHKLSKEPRKAVLSSLLDFLHDLHRAKFLSDEQKWILVQRLLAPVDKNSTAKSFLQETQQLRLITQNALFKDFFEQPEISLSAFFSAKLGRLLPGLNAEELTAVSSFWLTDHARTTLGLFSYSSCLQSLSSVERKLLLPIFEQFLLAASGGPERFTAWKYQNPRGEHRQKFVDHSQLLQLWQKEISQPLELADECSASLATTPKVDYMAIFQQKIEQGHLPPVPYLQDFLANPFHPYDVNTPKSSSEPCLLFQAKAIEFLQTPPQDVKERKTQLETLKNLLKGFASQAEFLNDLQGLIDGLKPKRKYGPGALLVASGNPLALFMCGSEVSDSCQRHDGNPRLNRCLVKYCAGFNIKMAAIQNGQGVIQARAMLKLLLSEKQTRQGTNYEPVLFIERPYPSTLSAEEIGLLLNIAKEQAKQLNIPLAFKDKSYERWRTSSSAAASAATTPPAFICLHSYGDGLPEYVDALNTIDMTYSIPQATLTL